MKSANSEDLLNFSLNRVPNAQSQFMQGPALHSLVSPGSGVFSVCHDSRDHVEIDTYILTILNIIYYHSPL